MPGNREGRSRSETMSKFIPILFLVLTFLLSLSLQVRSERLPVPSLPNKENTAALEEAHKAFQDRVANNPQDYDLRVQGADNVYYLVIQLDDKKQKKALLLQGIDWSKQAIALRPEAPGGHFFYGILTGLYVQMSDFFTALKSKDIIKDEMEKVVRLDPHFSDGDAYIALGQWYAAVPFFLGGSDGNAKDYLLKAIEMGPDRGKPHLALAEFYSKRFKYELAKKEIAQVFAAPLDGRFAFENKRDRAEAQLLLSKIENKLNQPARSYDRVSTKP